MEDNRPTALQQPLLQQRQTEGDAARDRWCPEEEAGWLSWLFFGFVSGLVEKGFQKPLRQEDLWNLPQGEETSLQCRSFEQALKATIDPLKAPQGSVWRALVSVHWRRFAWAALLEAACCAGLLLNPFILQQLLLEIEHGARTGVGMGLASALAATSLIETIVDSHYWFAMCRLELRTKAQLIDLIFRKSLKITSATKGSRGVGAIVNLQSNDGSKIWELIPYLHAMWSAPLQMLVIMMLLVRIIGLWPALAGLVATCSIGPISAWISSKMEEIRESIMECSDARVKAISELLAGIKAIKLYAWEVPWAERISLLREQELAQIKREAMLNIVGSLLWLAGPILVSLTSLATYTLLGNNLTAAVAFPALALFDLLSQPVNYIPMIITELASARVASGRISAFLAEPELSGRQKSLQKRGTGDGSAISIQHGTFSWEAGAEPILKNLKMNIWPGQLVMVTGPVGSGKTSLLAAILGELQGPQARVSVTGSVAYTAQDPWIAQATLRDNILMGQAMNDERYHQALDACALLPDLPLLPAGDLAEIGEKGINLSGGQKHRVALARACYAAADINLLDDPLSAVDAHVGQHIFEHAIRSLLGSSTRILVTHQQQFLPAADVILIVNEGKITDAGSFEELKARGVEFKHFELQRDGVETHPAGAACPSDKDIPASQDLLPVARSAGRRNSIGDSTHSATAPSSPLTAAVTLQSSESSSSPPDQQPIAPPAPQESPAGSQYPSAAQTKVQLNRSNEHHNLAQHPSPGTAGLALRDTTSAAVAAQRPAAKEFSEAPQAADVQSARQKGPAELPGTSVADNGESIATSGFRPWLLPFLLLLALIRWRRMCGSLYGPQAGSMTSGSPVPAFHYLLIYAALGGIAVVLLVAEEYSLVMGGLRASRKLHANLLERVMRLPMSFFDSQPSGRLLNRFTKDTEAVDTEILPMVSEVLITGTSVVGALLTVIVISPWVALLFIPLLPAYEWVRRRFLATAREVKRLDAIAASPIFSNFGETLQGLVTVRAFHQEQQFLERNRRLIDESNRCFIAQPALSRWVTLRLQAISIVLVFATATSVVLLLRDNPGLAGLALTSALSTTGVVQWLVQEATSLEVRMNSVERIIEYTTKHEPEALAVIKGSRPPQSWPQKGCIGVQDLVVRYRPSLPPVLKGLTFCIQAQEKVGVAGRTGCGKSTLMMALYRLVEPSGGHIIIDGINISSIGLADLRSRLALVPQDPVIFSGSIRDNLDPFGSAGGDTPIWQALEQASVVSAVQDQGGLDAEVTEGGGNLSAGQRQLLCMARALLRKPRILVLDEATSNVDNETDDAVQMTVRKAFKECTVLTIAHRLHTIIDAERILLLHAGCIQEFDSPEMLLKDPGSSFYQLVHQNTGV
ncbi:hypothetical protein WJX74_009211 [Apatococcus lobatus]|uniref:Uncharacterized protein n=1 Tax=Apatococcus lobatus TaxID=904363 RepID=A0AAW1Q5G6_9CHLO